MNLNIDIQHIIHPDELVGEHIDISFNDNTHMLFLDIIRKATSTEEEWAKALELKSQPLEFVEYFITLKR